MGAPAVKSFSHIAIMAKDLKADRKLVLNQPPIEIAADFLTVRGPIVVDMIDRQELVGCFTATSTPATIMVEDDAAPVVSGGIISTVHCPSVGSIIKFAAHAHFVLKNGIVPMLQVVAATLCFNWLRVGGIA